MKQATGIYQVDFRKGNWVAVSDRKEAGVSCDFMDNSEGSFNILASDKTGKDLRAKGMLKYDGTRYLKFAETGKPFLKVGPDAPENFLAYADFDGTFHNDGHKDNLVKTWEAHLKDWKNGDPTWQNGKGKAMIGAVNYLASKGMNVFSFLTNNIVGDASWGLFDYRKKDEDYGHGFQSVPVNWGISSPRKKAFFDKLEEITGGLK